MDFSPIDVQIRSTTGKGPARRLRAAGRVPAVLYGHKQDPVMLDLSPRELLATMDKEKKRNTVFALKVSGEGAKPEEITAMVKEAQIDAIKQTISHIDFIRVSMDEEVHVTVPLYLNGNPKGVVLGGTLHQDLHELALAAKPNAIPARIDLDISGMDLGSVLHVSDLPLAEGVRSLLSEKDPVASVSAPHGADKKAEEGEGDSE